MGQIGQAKSRQKAGKRQSPACRYVYAFKQVTSDTSDTSATRAIRATVLRRVEFYSV